MGFSYSCSYFTSPTTFSAEWNDPYSQMRCFNSRGSSVLLPLRNLLETFVCLGYLNWAIRKLTDEGSNGVDVVPLQLFTIVESARREFTEWRQASTGIVSLLNTLYLPGYAGLRIPVVHTWSHLVHVETLTVWYLFLRIYFTAGSTRNGSRSTASLVLPLLHCLNHPSNFEWHNFYSHSRNLYQLRFRGERKANCPCCSTRILLRCGSFQTDWKQALGEQLPWQWRLITRSGPAGWVFCSCALWKMTHVVPRCPVSILRCRLDSESRTCSKVNNPSYKSMQALMYVLKLLI